MAPVLMECAILSSSLGPILNIIHNWYPATRNFKPHKKWTTSMVPGVTEWTALSSSLGPNLNIIHIWYPATRNTKPTRNGRQAEFQIFRSCNMMPKYNGLSVLLRCTTGPTQWPKSSHSLASKDAGDSGKSLPPINRFPPSIPAYLLPAR